MGQCLKPNTGYYNDDGTHTFGISPTGHHQQHEIPCGYCEACLTNRTRIKGYKAHTNVLYHPTEFLTLTYNDENLPKSPSGLPTFDLTHIPLMLKKLRNKITPKGQKTNPYKKISFFYCREYGEKDQRPHYHGLLYNYTFQDKTYWKKHGLYDVYRSQLLEEIWPYGISEIGTATIQSATYIAGYIYKKFKNGKKIDYGDRIPEYVTSPKRNHVLGREYLEKNLETLMEQGCYKDINGLSYPISKSDLNYIEQKLLSPEVSQQIKLLKESYDVKKLTKEELAIKIEIFKQKKKERQ